MAQGKDPVMTRPNGGGSDRSHQIEADIDRTRAAMDRTVDAIAGKLTPQQLMFEAMGVFKDGTSALATKVVETAREHPVPATIIGIGLGLLFTEKSRSEKDSATRVRTGGFTGYGAYPAGEPSARTEGYAAGGYSMGGSAQPAGFTAGYTRTGGAGETGRSEGGFATTVKDKTADIRDSVALGAMEAREKVGETAAHVKETAAEAAARVRNQAGHLKDQVASGTEHVRESADHLREQVSERAGRVREQAAQVPVYARQQWHDAQLGFWQTMDQKPFAVGLAVLAAGVAAGFTVPASRKEQELMGETRDRLLEQAKGLGREAVGNAKQVARATTEVVKSEFERQGLKPGAIADKVRSISREAEHALKEEAGKVMPEPLKAAGSSAPSMTGTGGMGGPTAGGAAGRGMSAGFASTESWSDPDSTSGTSGTTGTSGTGGTTGTTGSRKTNNR